MDVSKVIDKKIDYWKKKLIDLSKRNNLVRYRFTKSKSLKIISPAFSKVIEDLENEQNIFILKEKKDNAKGRQWLCSEEEETIEKKLYTLYLKAKENFQELGVSTCFLSLGILRYKDADNSELFLGSSFAQPSKASLTQPNIFSSLQNFPSLCVGCLA